MYYYKNEIIHTNIFNFDCNNYFQLSFLSLWLNNECYVISLIYILLFSHFYSCMLSI